jgi:hypothetical protein
MGKTRTSAGAFFSAGDLAILLVSRPGADADLIRSVFTGDDVYGVGAVLSTPPTTHIEVVYFVSKGLDQTLFPFPSILEGACAVDAGHLVILVAVERGARPSGLFVIPTRKPRPSGGPSGSSGFSLRLRLPLPHTPAPFSKSHPYEAGAEEEQGRWLWHTERCF